MLDDDRRHSAARSRCRLSKAPDDASVKIPEGSESGKQFRLKGKGMSVLRTAARGDMYAEIVVETPVNLSKKQKELLQQFQDEGKKHGSSSPEADSFFQKVKEFFGKEEE